MCGPSWNILRHYLHQAYGFRDLGMYRINAVGLLEDFGSGFKDGFVQLLRGRFAYLGLYKMQGVRI